MFDEDRLEDDFFDDEDIEYDAEQRPVYDKSFLDEDLLEDPFDETEEYDEYGEEHLHEEGFSLDQEDLAEETHIYSFEESFDLDD